MRGRKVRFSRRWPKGHYRGMVDILYHFNPIIISSSVSLFHAISCSNEANLYSAGYLKPLLVTVLCHPSCHPLLTSLSPTCHPPFGPPLSLLVTPFWSLSFSSILVSPPFYRSTIESLYTTGTTDYTICTSNLNITTWLSSMNNSITTLTIKHNSLLLHQIIPGKISAECKNSRQFPF